MAEFAHLHVHTEYSLLDGAIPIKKLAGAAKDMGLPAIALTDHNNMFGAIRHYKACKAAGITPILGCEVNVVREKKLNNIRSATAEITEKLTPPKTLSLEQALEFIACLDSR